MSEPSTADPTATASPKPQALDIQHDTDPEEDHGKSRRIPHIGHAVAFFFLAWLSLNLCVFLCLVLFKVPIQTAAQHPGVLLFAQALSYLCTLLVSFALFPQLWDRTFAQGIEWNVLAARRSWRWIVPGALVLSGAAQFADRFVVSPKNNTMTQLLHFPAGAWGVTALGVLLAPLAEEIAFRGFLLPALATAYDWLALERSPAGLRRWQMTSGHTRGALVFGALFSNIPFALLHAGQLGHAWGALSVLFAVGLVLSYVRIRTHSVACSTMLHAAYNLTIFVAMFIATGGYRHLEKL